jgi:hypothetical protein
MRLAPPPYVVEVHPPTSHIPAGVYFSLETPLPGGTVSSLVIEVAGWVAHTDRCELSAPNEVAVLIDGEPWLSTRVELARDDVGPALHEDFGEQTTTNLNGFCLALPVYLSGRLDTVYTLVALLGPERHPGYVIATISFQTRACLPDHWRSTRPMTPVLITSLGRSGSSVLCRMFSEHPVFYSARGGNQFGELRVLEFISRLVSVVSSEGCSSELNTLETQPDFKSLPAPVFASRILGGSDRKNSNEQNLLVYLSENILKLAQGFLDEYFSQIGKFKPESRYLVEKNWNVLSTNSLRIFFDNTKEIFLVRNPVSFWNSQIAFFKKEHLADEVLRSHKDALAQQYRALARAWRDRRGNAILVHYEALVTQPEQTLAHIFGYLGCELDPAFAAKAAGMLGDSSAHSQMLRTHIDGDFDTEFDAYLRSLEDSTRDDLVRSARDLGYEL